MSSRCFAQLAATAALLCIAGAAAAQPANDTCGGATAAVVGANPGSLIGASNEGSSSNSCEGGGGVDVFFSFIPPASGVYAFSLCQDNVFFDSIISIHTGCATDAANELACDDDGCGFFADLSEIASVTLTAGLPQPYIIRVSTFDDVTAGDSFVLNISVLTSGACCQLDGTCLTTASNDCVGQFQGADTTCTPSPCTPTGSCCSTAQCCTIEFQSGCVGGTWTLGGVCNPTPCIIPANDACLGALPLTAGVPVTGSNCSAGDDQTASCATTTAANTHKTVWYAFTPTHSAAYTLNTCGTSFDSLLAVFSGGCGALTEIACNDDSTSAGNVVCSGNGLNSRIPTVVLNQGVTYRVLVAAWGVDPDGGTYSLAVNAINALGSCCNGETCSQTDLARCSSVFTLGGTCSPNLCLPSTGACCAGSTCSLTAAASCTGPNRAYAGVGTVCNAFSGSNPAQNRTPCCLANFNHSSNASEPTVQDIFDFLSAYFSNDPIANINGSTNASEPTVQDIFDFLAAYFNGC